MLFSSGGVGLCQGCKAAVAFVGLRLHEYGAADIDDVYPGPGNLGDIAFLDTAINAYLEVGVGAAEVDYLVQDFRYELAAVEPRVDRQEKYAVQFADQRSDSRVGGLWIEGYALIPSFLTSGIISCGEGVAS